MSSSSDKYSGKPCQQRTTNGDPCPTPALPDKRFCRYHEITGPPPINTNNIEAGPFFHIYLPQLGDAASIQSAISEVCEMMLHRRIEPKEASALFYAMQVASSNLDHLHAGKTQKLVSETSSDTSSEPNRLPPGTIQASEQPRHRNRRPRS